MSLSVTLLNWRGSLKITLVNPFSLVMGIEGGALVGDDHEPLVSLYHSTFAAMSLTLL